MHILLNPSLLSFYWSIIPRMKTPDVSYSSHPVLPASIAGVYWWVIPILSPLEDLAFWCQRRSSSYNIIKYATPCLVSEERGVHILDTNALIDRKKSFRERKRGENGERRGEEETTHFNPIVSPPLWNSTFNWILPSLPSLAWTSWSGIGYSSANSAYTISLPLSRPYSWSHSNR